MLINLDNLRALSRDNDAFLREILKVYLDNTPVDLANMRAAVIEENWHVVRYFAHKMKSSSYTIGFVKGHAQFQKIEHSVRDENIEGIPQAFDVAVELCRSCMTEVEHELHRLS